MSGKKRGTEVSPSLLSVQDVATMLGVCRQTVYTYIYREGLPSISVRGIRRIRPESLNSWLEEREQRFV
jgi:excisionase family DNA binding protein